MSTASAPPRRKRSLGKRILTSLVILILAAIYLLYFHDAAPQDDRDMMPPATPAPTEASHNPLEPFFSALKADRISLQDALPQPIKKFEPGSSGKAREFLDAHPASLQAFADLMKTDPATWRWTFSQTENMVENHKSTPLGMVGPIVNTMILKARIMAEDGHHADAVQSLLEVLRFGHALEQTPGTDLLAQLVTSIIQANAIPALESVLANKGTDAVYLSRVQQTLASLESRRLDYQASMKVEHAQVKTTFRYFKSGKLPEHSSGSLAKTPDRSYPGWVVPLNKPNMTAASQLAFERPIMSALDTSWVGALQAAKKLDDMRRAEVSSHFFWLDLNLYGKSYLATFVYPGKMLLERKAEAVARLRQMVIVLALRRHELEQGKLPASLQELVPQYLETVPMDPFDDKPMRWNPSLQSVYSVYRDFNDDGGTYDQSANARRQKDLILPCWWSPHVSTQREHPKPPAAPKRTRANPNPPSSK